MWLVESVAIFATPDGKGSLLFLAVKKNSVPCLNSLMIFVLCTLLWFLGAVSATNQSCVVRACWLSLPLCRAVGNQAAQTLGVHYERQPEEKWWFLGRNCPVSASAECFHYGFGVRRNPFQHLAVQQCWLQMKCCCERFGPKLYRISGWDFSAKGLKEHKVFANHFSV